MNMLEPDPYHLLSLEVVVRMTGCPRRKIVFYCRKGIIRPVKSDHEEWHFDLESILRLRHIESLRHKHRMNWAALASSSMTLRENGAA